MVAEASIRPIAVACKSVHVPAEATTTLAVVEEPGFSTHQIETVALPFLYLPALISERETVVLKVTEFITVSVADESYIVTTTTKALQLAGVVWENVTPVELVSLPDEVGVPKVIAIGQHLLLINYVPTL